MRRLEPCAALALAVLVGAAPASAAPSKEEVLREASGALDDKLKELFDVPETPAAEALGVTGDAVAHPDTVKDVALQVLAAVSDEADISEGVALEFAPFRTAVYSGNLEQFERLGYGQHLVGNLALSLATVNTPETDGGGVRYSFGLRVPFLDDHDYRRNGDYRRGIVEGLESCVAAIQGTDTKPPLRPQDVDAIGKAIDAHAEALKTVDRLAGALDEARAKETIVEQALDALEAKWNEPATPSDGRAKASDFSGARLDVQQLIQVEQLMLAIDNARANVRKAEDRLLESARQLDSDLNETGGRIDSFSDPDGQSRLAVRLTAVRAALKASVEARTLTLGVSRPPQGDSNKESGAVTRESELQRKFEERCSTQVKTMSTLVDQLQGNRLELQTATIVSDTPTKPASWDQTVVSAAYERRWRVGYVGIAGRGKFSDADSVKVAVDSGLRAGFDTGRFAGALSAAAGAADLSSPEFTFVGGANTSVILADTFLARLGVLTNYEHGPGLGITAYLAIATANGEDFFTRVIGKR